MLAALFVALTAQFGSGVSQEMPRATKEVASIHKRYSAPGRLRLQAATWELPDSFPWTLEGTRFTLSILTYFDYLNYKIEAVQIDADRNVARRCVLWMDQGRCRKFWIDDNGHALVAGSNQSGQGEPWIIPSPILYQFILDFAPLGGPLGWYLAPDSRSDRAVILNPSLGGGYVHHRLTLSSVQTGQVVAAWTRLYEKEILVQYQELPAPQSVAESRFAAPPHALDLGNDYNLTPKDKVNALYRVPAPQRVTTTVEFTRTSQVDAPKKTATLETVFFDRNNFRCTMRHNDPEIDGWAFWNENGRRSLKVKGVVSEAAGLPEDPVMRIGFPALLSGLLSSHRSLSGFLATTLPLPKNGPMTTLASNMVVYHELEVDESGRIQAEKIFRNSGMRHQRGLTAIFRHTYDPVPPTLADTRVTLP